MIDLVIRLVLAYLLGSLMGGLLLGRLRGVDIRSSGSGNAGATNAWRTQGAMFGLLVFVIDIGKGLLAVWLVPALPIPFAAADPELVGWTPYLCGITAVLGHLYPVFFGFRGGKGAATLAGVVVALLPQTVPAMLLAWVLTLVLTGMVGLSTMVAAAVATTWVGFTDPAGLAGPAGMFAACATALVLYTHRANISRMLDGNENRFEKAMLLHRLLGRGQDQGQVDKTGDGPD